MDIINLNMKENRRFDKQQFFFDEELGFEPKVDNIITKKQALNIIDRLIDSTKGELNKDALVLKKWISSKSA